MVFSYNDYYFNCLALPLFVLLFASVALIPGMVISLKEMITKGISTGRVSSFLFFLFILLFFIRLNGGRLINGGMYLFLEKAEAAITAEGTIEEITLLNQFSFPNISEYDKYESRTSPNIYGYKIVVNNIVLKAPAIGALMSGDHVSVTFLPKSRYVLSISKDMDEISVNT